MATHAYDRDPNSNAGNCRCGAAEKSLAHPHTFMAAGVNSALCVCSKPRTADVHIDTGLQSTWT